MSGQTTTGKGLQFTDDNKYASLYSGEINTDGTTTTNNILADFTTQSNYLVAQIAFQTYNNHSDNMDFRINFNGVNIERIYYLASTNTYNYSRTNFYWLIPPFTHVTLTGRNDGSATAIPVGVAVSAEVGMAPRVGN